MMETSQSPDIAMGFYHFTLHPSVCGVIQMEAHTVQSVAAWRNPIGACFYQCEQLSPQKKEEKKKEACWRDPNKKTFCFPAYHRQGIFSDMLLSPFKLQQLSPDSSVDSTLSLFIC